MPARRQLALSVSEEEMETMLMQMMRSASAMTDESGNEMCISFSDSFSRGLFVCVCVKAQRNEKKRKQPFSGMKRTGDHVHLQVGQNQKKKKKKKNALHLLMKSSSRVGEHDKPRRVKLSETFVSCPLCSKDVFHRDMDMHMAQWHTPESSSSTVGTPERASDTSTAAAEAVDKTESKPVSALQLLAQPRPARDFKKRIGTHGTPIQEFNEAFSLVAVPCGNGSSSCSWKWEWHVEAPESQLKDFSAGAEQVSSGARQLKLFDQTHATKQGMKRRTREDHTEGDPICHSPDIQSPAANYRHDVFLEQDSPNSILDAKMHVEKMQNLLRTHTMKSYEAIRYQQSDNSNNSTCEASLLSSHKPESKLSSCAPLKGFQTASGGPVNVPFVFRPSSASASSNVNCNEEKYSLDALRLHALRELCKSQPFSARCTTKLTPSSQALVKLMTNMPSGIYPSPTIAADMFLWKKAKRSTGFSPSLLKSLLQKNVRMCRPDAAVRVAKELMIHSFDEFIRRITVIIIEDAILHPYYPFLVWLMFSSSKGFIPNDEHIDTCLQIVYEVASVVFKEVIPDSLVKELQQCGHKIDLTKLSESDVCLVKSLIGRASFGGMTGDIRMLRRFALLWYFRLSSFEGSDTLLSESSPLQCGLEPKCIKRDSDVQLRSEWIRFLHSVYKMSSRIVRFDLVSDICKDDIMLSAVDMHCSSLIDDIVADEQMYKACLNCFQSNLGTKQLLDREWIKSQVHSAVWIHRSSSNCKLDTIYRCEQTETANDIARKALFDIIKDRLDELSYQHIKSRMRPPTRNFNDNIIHGQSSSIIHRLPRR